MPSTTNLAIPYPVTGDPPHGPNQIGAAAAAIDVFYGAWTPWTPAVTQSTTITFSAVDCAYRVIGKDVHLRGHLKVSGGGTAANKIIIPGPPSIPAVIAAEPVGFGRIYDISASAQFEGQLEFDAGSTANLVIMLTAGTAGNNNFTAALAFNDIITFWGWYARS